MCVREVREEVCAGVEHIPYFLIEAIARSANIRQAADTTPPSNLTPAATPLT